MGLYQFPKNTRAADSTLYEQASKIQEEASEVLESIDNLEQDSRILEETYDVINACEGLLRKFPKEKVEAAKLYVRSKCAERGEYMRVGAE